MSQFFSAGLLGSAIPGSAVSRWTFDDADTSGSTAIDVWGGNDGTINGATTGVSGVYKQAYSFDGTDDSVDVGSPVIGTTNTTFTAAVWVKFATLQDGYTISEWGSNNAWAISYRSGPSALDYRIQESGGTQREIQYPDSNFATGSWHLVGLIADGGSAEFRGKFDTTDVGTNSNWDGTIDNDVNLTFGSTAHGYNLLDGDLDDPRLYDKALTDTEWNNLYNTGSIDG